MIDIAVIYCMLYALDVMLFGSWLIVDPFQLLIGLFTSIVIEDGPGRTTEMMFVWFQPIVIYLPSYFICQCELFLKCHILVFGF